MIVSYLICSERIMNQSPSGKRSSRVTSVNEEARVTKVAFGELEDIYPI